MAPARGRCRGGAVGSGLTRFRPLPIVCCMKTELNELEGKVQSLIALCQRLRRENGELRQQLASSHNENARLGEKVSVAAQRIEALLQTIPESAT